MGCGGSKADAEGGDPFPGKPGAGPADTSQVQIAEKPAPTVSALVLEASKTSNIKLIPWDDLQLNEELGKGAFGVVMACSFQTTPCAVKQLLNDQASAVTVVKDLLAEYDVMMTLRHPNVVLMLGIATDHVHHTGIVLELLEVSLQDILHQPMYKAYRTWRLSLLSIACDVAKGIAYLHFNNLLHRDLKPGNVLLSSDWVAKVADFGTSTTPKLDQDGEKSLAGTPPYMAPEVTRGEQQHPPVDVWSFGCLLVHMASSRPPYYNLMQDGLVKTARDVVNLVKSGAVSPVASLLTKEAAGWNCPPAIIELAKKCCSREQVDRPEMSTIAAALFSPALQQFILKGGEPRPLVRLHRNKALPPPQAEPLNASVDASAMSTKTRFRQKGQQPSQKQMSPPPANIKYPLGTHVLVKRSNGDETAGWIAEFDAGENMYVVQLDDENGSLKKAHEEMIRVVPTGGR